MALAVCGADIIPVAAVPVTVTVLVILLGMSFCRVVIVPLQKIDAPGARALASGPVLADAQVMPAIVSSLIEMFEIGTSPVFVTV